jgi:hypothetical protein
MPLDFVMVRFATKPYSFMRMGHRGIAPWLTHKKIEYTIKDRYVYFELPEDLQEYTVVTSELAKAVGPLGREVKRLMSALSWTQMAKVRQPLSEQEIACLVENNIQVIL